MDSDRKSIGVVVSHRRVVLVHALSSRLDPQALAVQSVGVLIGGPSITGNYLIVFGGEAERWAKHYTRISSGP